ncbi:hypothetical protein Taro_021796 [Colocasia esculenta]|uniref:Pentatricopeptide repeat-containing protein n=1 Tax=Colocasia esculenta TaxID=4460 RepID=A0A843V6F4_COLES|nr:hypothetical protein [Colocasia esculenta]
MPISHFRPWNAAIRSHCADGRYLDALAAFCQMHQAGLRPDCYAVAATAKSCALLTYVALGKSVHGFVTKGVLGSAPAYGQVIHAYVVKTGLEEETLVGNALVSMYAKCGSVTVDACRVFHLMTCKDVVSWNSIVAGLVENGFVAEAFDSFYQMVSMGLKPNYATVVNVLPVSALLPQGWHWGKEIHCYVLRSAMETVISVSNALMTHYARVGDLKDAEKVFRNMHLVDVVSWNTIISGYAMNGWHQRALALFHELLASGVEPDAVTLITVLPVCAHLRNIEEGKKIHNYILRTPVLQRDTTVGNALVSFYGKCGQLDYAFQTFANISDRDLISWNAMMAAYADNENVKGAVDILYHMHLRGIRPDSVTVLSILQICMFLGMGKTREIHGYSVRASLVETPAVGNAIIDAYAKCGCIEHAVKTFQSLSGRNIVSGNTMISVYMKHGSLEEAIKIFEEMTDRDLSTWNLMIQAFAQNDYVDQAISSFLKLQYQLMKPDLMSIMSILPVCARLASVHLVKQCHSYIIRGLLDDIRVEGALLDAYCKCGSIYDAQELFQSSSRKDLVTYTAMIGGYAMNGMAKEALATFYDMQQSDIKPDHVIITSLLSACSHAGLVDGGLKLFRTVGEAHGMKHTMEHYACVVDLFARRGQLREAYDFIVGMPCEANANVWGTLLGACRKYGEMKIGQLVANHLFAIEEKNIGNYVIMSNIYAADARWDAVEQVRMLLKAKELRKPAGCSWIEVERSRHVFIADDLSHPERIFIYDMVRFLNWEIKEPLSLEELINHFYTSPPTTFIFSPHEGYLLASSAFPSHSALEDHRLNDITSRLEPDKFQSHSASSALSRLVDVPRCFAVLRANI